VCVCVCVCVCGRDSGGVNDSSVVCFNSSHWPTSTFLCCLSLTSPREYRCYKARGKGQGPRPKGDAWWGWIRGGLSQMSRVSGASSE
jgi:hypothetical protein